MLLEFINVTVTVHFHKNTVHKHTKSKVFKISQEKRHLSSLTSSAIVNPTDIDYKVYFFRMFYL